MYKFSIIGLTTSIGSKVRVRTSGPGNLKDGMKVYSKGGYMGCSCAWITCMFCMMIAWYYN